MKPLHTLRTLLAALLALLFLTGAADDDLREMQYVRGYLNDGEFAPLEALYERVRAERSRRPDGEFLFESFVQMLASGDWPRDDRDRQTEAWLKRSPGKPVAAIVRAFLLIQRARALDSQKKWGEIDAVVKAAEDVLMSVAPAARNDANWHAARLQLGALQGWTEERVRRAVEEAAAVDPYPLLPYVSAAAALSPDGRQSARALAWLVALAAGRTQSTEGKSMYARVYLTGVRYFPEVRASPFSPGHMDWPLLDASVRDWIARYPTQPLREDHAALACVAGDRARAAVLVKELGVWTSRRAFEYWGGKALYERCRIWVDAPPARAPGASS